MNRDAELLGKIFQITRGDLESAVFPHPQLGLAISGLSFARIARISRFWAKENENQLLLEKCTEDLITGFYGQSCSWMFLLNGTSKAIECWLGVAQAPGEGTSLNKYLAGAFPDVRINNTSFLEGIDFDRLRCAVVLTGTPSPKADLEHDQQSDQIEKVCRGLYGGHWVYGVIAEPLSPVETVKTINEITQEIRSVYSTHMLKASATDERNRIAQRYIELMEAKLKRLEQGRTCGMWTVHTVFLTDSILTLGRAQALLHSAFSGGKSIPDPIRVHVCQGDAHDNPVLEPLTSMEASILARPPREAYPGYEVVDYARFGVETIGSAFHGSRSVKVGDVFDRGMATGNSLFVPIRDITKHGLVVGVTGSGKSNTCMALLDQIWDAGKGVPFLVIESAKSEYRQLLRNPRFKGLKVFTVGDETTSPLRLNPFEVPKGILIQTHIDYLKSLFSAAFVLYPPMPYVLEQSIQEVYEDRGWDLARNINHRGNITERSYPSLLDLTTKIGVVVNRMGYDERITMDVKAGLLARINQLRIGGGKGLMFNSRKSLDLSVLFGSSCLLELKQIVSDDEKAFIIGLILIRLYEYYEAKSDHSRGDLSHVTLIEEAHRLLRNVSMEQGSEVNANPKGRAIEVFANILSEIRAYGEGILIAEQIPAKLTPDAIKNTNLKIVHRMVAEDDRRVVGTTMNLSESQLRYLTTLRTGEAIAYTEGMQKPVLLTVPLVSSRQAASTEEVKTAMKSFWYENQNLFRMFPGCAQCPSNNGFYCNFKTRTQVDVLLVESFSRLLNTLRLNRALVLDAYSDFNLSCQRNPAYQQEKTGYCIFLELLEHDIERHGEYYAWSHEDVGKVIQLACAIMSKLTVSFGKTEIKTLEKECSKDLMAFSNLFKRLCKVDVLPFPGCRFCNDPCYYRYDMRYPDDEQDVTGFRSAFMDSEIHMDELARICWNTTPQAFFPKDIRSRRGAALCFAVQQFSELGLSRVNQEEMTDQIAYSLGTFGGNS